MIDPNTTDVIDRYLNGRMSSDELMRFSEQLVSDPKLRAMLDAEELIRGTIRRDLDAVPAEHPETHAHVMGTLAALSSAARNGILPDPGLGSKASGGSNSASFFGSGTTMKIIVGAAVGIGIVMGMYMLIPRSDVAMQKPVPHIEQMHVEPAAPRVDSSPAVSPLQADPVQAQQSPAASPSVSTAPSKPLSTTRPERAEGISRAPRAMETPKVQQSESNASVPQDEPVQVESSRQKPRKVLVRKNDSVRLQMQVKEKVKE